jgi:maltose/moltooligosaccharide transporter
LESTRIGYGKMALLGVGWFGTQFFWGLHAGSMPLFLKGFTDSKFKISLVLSLAGLAGCIVPPVVGYFSDRSRFGRRRPYIFLGGIGAFLSILSLPHLSTFALVALLSGCMYFSLRLSETPYLSLLPDITPPQQRSTASGMMNLFGSLGLISFFLLSSGIWERSPALVFSTAAIVCFGTLFLAISFLVEPPQEEIEITAREASAFKRVVKYCKSISDEANAVGFFAAQFFWWLGFWMVSTFATLFAVEELGISEGRSFFILMVFSVVATVCMVPLGVLGDRFGRKGILSVLIGSWAVTEVLVGFSQNLTHALITVGLTAIPFAGVMGIGYAFFLDLIPRNRTAEFVGFSIISIATAQIVGPMLGGKVIDNFGYRSIFPIAAAFMITGLIVLQFVRPRRESQAVTSIPEATEST